MAFGIPYASETETFPLADDANLGQILAMAKMTAQELGWSITTSYKNGFTAETGFKAKKGLVMSDFGEHIMVKVEKGNLLIRSQSEPLHFFDRGKNRTHIQCFSEKYRELSQKATEVPESTDETEILQFPGEEETELFTIENNNRKRVIATPTLVVINICVFILMVANGASFMQPDSETLLEWGANFRPEIIEGAYWRLLTSCFIHIGIFHLFMNMYALVYVGHLLEPLMGYAKFTWAFLLSGIVGSIASIFWQEFTVSAGASGAIFGMFGVFISVTTTKLISAERRRPMLINMAVFLGYNLLIGTSQGIDNAAHIGGLLSGVLIGYLWYLSFSKSDNPLHGTIAMAALAIVICVCGSFMIKGLDNHYGKYMNRMERFAQLEDDALLPYSLLGTGRSDHYMLEVLEKDGQDNWKKALALLDSLEELSLPEKVVEYNHRLTEYCELQMEYYDALSNQITTPGPVQDSLVQSAQRRIEILVALMNAEAKS